MTERIPLSLLPRELRAVGGPAVSYRVAYKRTLDGKIPAERGDNGRWTVARADLVRIAQALAGTAQPGAAERLAA